ncbi:MAG TPA: protein translocase subunit SecF [Blastocatellia bacterium]|nr:protein translocase subunit SecF [Blastocatellia bacterium]
MVELLRNPRLNWIAAKKYFITVTIFLLLVGAISMQVRGFNLGVDFTGGTLMTVRFKEPPDLDKVRATLGRSGIDISKVTLQPVVTRPTEILVHAPQLAGGSEAERRIDQDKRTITSALQRLNPGGDDPAGKVNINSIDAGGIEAELRQIDPLAINARQFANAHPYRQVGDQIVFYRDSQGKGFLQSIDSLQGLNLTAGNYAEFDQSKIKAFLAARFYAGKIDLNLAGTGEIEDALSRIDPLGVGVGSDVYAKAAQAITSYRKESNGVINDLHLIQVQNVSAALLQKMEPYFTEGGFAILSADVVGAVVGADLRNRAIYVTLAAMGGMLIFVALRFEWIFGVAAITAVFHDILIVLGLFSLFQWEINLTVIAGLLTLVGYSMNDSIVIFDRIRENLRTRRKDSLVQIVNDSINQTLSRTVIASGLTFISVLAIVVFGGPVLRGFGLVLTIGIVLGTYDSIAIASPTMVWWKYFTEGEGGRGPSILKKAA